MPTWARWRGLPCSGKSPTYSRNASAVSVVDVIPKRRRVSGPSTVRSRSLDVSANPFSACRLPAGTTTLESVTAGRSVAMGDDDASLDAARAAVPRASVRTKKNREGFRTLVPVQAACSTGASRRSVRVVAWAHLLIDAQQPTATSINKCNPGVLVTSPRFAHNRLKILPSE